MSEAEYLNIDGLHVGYHMVVNYREEIAEARNTERALRLKISKTFHDGERREVELQDEIATLKAQLSEIDQTVNQRGIFKCGTCRMRYSPFDGHHCARVNLDIRAILKNGTIAYRESSHD